MLKILLLRLYTGIAQVLDWSAGWHRMPPLIGLIMLLAMRIKLRKRNLYNTTGVNLVCPCKSVSDNEASSSYLVARTTNGMYNDLDVPTIGSAETRFGRNVPLKYAYPASDTAILTPNPRTISLELLARDTFTPATTLNLLAAAWIQFMVHDWFSHGKNQKENPWKVALDKTNPWPYHPMTILRTHRDPARRSIDKNLPPTYLNTATHWWDGSQIYGNEEETQTQLRSGEHGKLRLADNGLLPVDAVSGIDITRSKETEDC